MYPDYLRRARTQYMVAPKSDALVTREEGSAKYCLLEDSRA